MANLSLSLSCCFISLGVLFLASPLMVFTGKGKLLIACSFLAAGSIALILVLPRALQKSKTTSATTYMAKLVPSLSSSAEGTVNIALENGVATYDIYLNLTRYDAFVSSNAFLRGGRRRKMVLGGCMGKVYVGLIDRLMDR